MSAAEYDAGMAAGMVRAAKFADILTHSEAAPEGSSPHFASGWRAAFASVRNRVYRAGPWIEPHVDNRTRPAYTRCEGSWAFLERLPHATVYACSCGQHRVRFDDPDGHAAAMAALADAIVDAADEIEGGS